MLTIADARAHSLGAYKSSSFEDIKAFSDIALYITTESELHVDVNQSLFWFGRNKPDTEQFCSKFGITRSQLLDTPESAACSAYARYILDVGAQGDILELYMAVASCLIGYGEVGLWLREQVNTGQASLEGNMYRRWIEDYSGPDYLAAVNRGIGKRSSPTKGLIDAARRKSRKACSRGSAQPCSDEKTRAYLARVCTVRKGFLGYGHEC
jgi:hydroxymethylpyrimidine/phosphomethylpyrimidine kinase